MCDIWTRAAMPETHCRTCDAPLEADEKPPHCASCVEYWEQLEVEIRHAHIDRSVAQRLLRYPDPR